MRRWIFVEHGPFILKSVVIIAASLVAAFCLFKLLKFESEGEAGAVAATMAKESSPSPATKTPAPPAEPAKEVLPRIESVPVVTTPSPNPPPPPAGSENRPPAKSGSDDPLDGLWPRYCDASVADGVLTLDTGKINLGGMPIALGQPGIEAPRAATGCI